MIKQHSEQIRKWLGILTSASIVVSGACLMFSCYRLYQADQFSREAVAAAFSQICIPVYICLALVVMGFLAECFLPQPPKKAPRKRPAAKAETAPAPLRLLSVKTALLCLAIILLLFGFFTGGTMDVLTKAVNICTECVGLG